MKETNEKILIVDDVSKNIQILGNILSQKHYQIAYANNGQQALDICNVQKFDLILLDIMMPGIDGYEVCKHLKENPATSEIPIIFLTAKADMDSIIKGFEKGGQDYITKPFNAAELLARVNTHLLIKRQRERLKLMNNHLEDLVRERTLELETANHQLSVLDQAKSNFLSLISHEIRTPLNGVIGLTELLDQTNIDSDQKEYLNYLKDVSARLMKFSDTALLITTLKINKYLPEILLVSVHQLINDAISEFIETHSNSTLQIKNNMPAETLLAQVDSDLIRTCFSIIIDNSARFAGEKAQLEISAHILEDSILLKFCDNGPGFSKAALDHLFELFSAGDILHAEGTGLGLAAAKLILDAHEGTIDIKNSDTGGAEITIKLKYNSIG
ncbi:MAG: response regulator [Bacteroidetes bacterium]|nr:response regulator [Bacteroidota bacterium]MBL6943976.1 response regulator [Bacteroidales bacterium]